MAATVLSGSSAIPAGMRASDTFSKRTLRSKPLYFAPAAD